MPQGVEAGAPRTAQASDTSPAVVPIHGGARIHCPSQQIAGTVNAEGLWLTSTTTGTNAARFRVVATSLGREFSAPAYLPPTGTVEVQGDVARFVRKGLIEEYRVSADGVQQDFLVETSPAGAGHLRLGLQVTGALAEGFGTDARLQLPRGRPIAYRQLHVTDAFGLELPSGLHVVSVDRLSVVMDDTGATYPVRVDPTFSDASWVSLGRSLPGAGSYVNAAVADASGSLYIAGNFNMVGDTAAEHVAKWDGKRWSALGTGMISPVHALAVADSGLYAGGYRELSQWNGASWTGVGPTLNGSVYALVAVGDVLYAAGTFSSAGTTRVSRIAKWDGVGWAPLGEGLDDAGYALAVSGGNLYVGGAFTHAGEVSANRIARWDGERWWPLSSGASAVVRSLVTWNGDLYAGGDFTLIGGVQVNRIARWDGEGWSPLGTGLTRLSGAVNVSALTVVGGELYAGGFFDKAAGTEARCVAK